MAVPLCFSSSPFSGVHSKKCWRKLAFGRVDSAQVEPYKSDRVASLSPMKETETARMMTSRRVQRAQRGLRHGKRLVAEEAKLSKRR